MVDFNLPKKLGFFCFNESPLKMIETAFYFTLLKALFVLKIFKFLPWLFWSSRKKAKVNFRVYDVIYWETSNNKYIVPIISRSKSKQAIKFCQLLEYNMRNIFFKNHEENEAGRLVLDLLLLSKKALYEVKASCQYLNFNIFW